MGDLVQLAPQLQPGEPDCKNCPLWEKKRTQVDGYFPTQSYCGLAFVGEQPWKEEAKAKLPFVGASGRLLWALAKNVGIPQDQVLVVNAISCFGGEWPEGDAAEKKAKRAARIACRPKLLAVLERWKPRVILALGGEAIRSVLDDDKATVGGHRGTVNRLAYGSPSAPGGAMPPTQSVAWVTGAEHPAALLRSEGFTAPILKKDLAKAWRWLMEGAPRAWEAHVEPAPSLQRTRELVNRWRLARRVTGDVETIPDPPGRWNSPLRMIGLGDEDLAAWWPFFDHEWRQFYSEQDWLEIRALLRGLLADPDVVKEFQNKQYDMAVLENHGFEVRGTVEDTMVMHHVLHLRGVAHDLGYIAAEYLDLPAWKKEFDKEWEAPLPDLGEYNGNDVLSTARVRPRMQADLVARGLWDTYVMDRDATDIALAMSRNGIWIDEHRRQEYLREYDEKAAELEAQTLELTGAAEQQVETLRLVADSNIGRWAKVKLKDIVEGARPDVAELVEVCDLVAGRHLQPKIVADLEESARKLRALLDPFSEGATATNWVPWMPLDPAGDTKADAKRFAKAEKALAKAAYDGDPEAAKAAEATLADPERLTLGARVEANAAARVACGRACSVIRSAVGRVTKALAQPINLESGKQMGQVIHSPRWLGLPVAEPSDKPGEYLTNEEALYHVSGHPAVKAWQAWGSAAYRRDWLRNTLPISADGRAHGAFKTTRTPTARWAGGSEGEEKWNPQNPEKDVIDVFAAPPGRRLVGRDSSMVEIRVAAGLSGDKRMIQQIKDFDEGRSRWDIHEQRAISCWPEFPTFEPEVRKKKRTLAKRANFGPIYGATKYMLLPVMLSQMKPLASLADNKRRNLELLEEAQRILDVIHNDWAELFLWLEEGYRRALRDGVIQSGCISGRTIHFPLRDRDHIDRRFCYNCRIQGTARELVVASMLRIARRLPPPPDALWVMDAHDQLLVDCAEDVADDVNRIMDEEMRGEIGGVPIMSDGGAAGGVAQNWRMLK